MIVDIGAGSGRLGQTIVNRYNDMIKNGMTLKIISLDPDEEMLKQAKKYFQTDCKVPEQYIQLEFVQGFGEDLKTLGDQSVDIICSALAIHHIDMDKKQKSMNEFFRVLKNETGKVVIGDFYADPVADAFIAKHMKHGTANEQVTNTDLLKNAGFKAAKHVFSNKIMYIMPAYVFTAEKN